MFTTPFAKFSKNTEKKLTFSLFFLFIISLVTMLYFDRFLTNETSVNGIISFELAGSLERSNEIIDSWSSLSKTYAGLSLGFDFLFLLVYTLFISLIIHKLNERLWKKKPFYRIGEFLIWSMFITAIFDALENVCLIKLLIGSQHEFWPNLAYYFAIIKFFLIIVSILFILYNLIILLFKKPS